MIDTIYNFGHNLLAATWWTAAGWPVIWNLIKIICVLLPLLGAVAYATLWERKFLGWIQVRHGPNRVGPMGLLQPIADALKLLTKELINPSAASNGLFRLGPVMAIMPALAAWVAIPFGPDVVLANVNAGLLLIMAITSIEVYGVIIAELEIRVLGCSACFGSDGQLRNRHGLLPGGGDHGHWKSASR